MKMPSTTQQAVTDALREMILNGHLVPGDRIDQDGVAQELGVSRMPVREGLRVLSAEGLVTIYPHHGAMVSVLSPEEMEDIFSIRAALEGMAGRLAVSSLTSDMLDSLARHCRAMSSVSRYDEWIVLNGSFHSEIYSACARPHLLGLIASLRNTVRPYIRLNISLADHLETAHAQHLEILDACCAGEGAAVEVLIRAHLQTTCEHLLVRYRRQGENYGGSQVG